MVFPPPQQKKSWKGKESWTFSTDWKPPCGWLLSLAEDGKEITTGNGFFAPSYPLRLRKQKLTAKIRARAREMAAPAELPR